MSGPILGQYCLAIWVVTFTIKTVKSHRAPYQVHCCLQHIYITPVGDIIKKFGLDYHLYADDTQLYVSFVPGGNSQLNTSDRLCSCLQEIGEWSGTNLLKLNDYKTDAIVF